MGSSKVILKTAKRGRGTIPRSKIRKAVQIVFDGTKAHPIVGPYKVAKATAHKKSQSHVAIGE